MASPPSVRPVAPVDLASERAELGEELLEAARRVLESGQYILGPEVERLEADMARLCRCAHGVGVASGTDAITLGLAALGVGPGDHVLTSPFTFFATVGAVRWLGAVPRLADVDPDTGLLDPASAREHADERTRCVMPVHLYGQMADMRAFRSLADERGLALFEDGAQAHGSSRDGVAPGELGDACSFSFYPTKNLGAAGEGGLVVTQKDDVAERLRRLRDHGSSEKYLHAFVGTNSRLHALQAAFLNVKLPHLEAWNERRRVAAARYDAAFASTQIVEPLRRHEGAVHAFHQYTVRVRPPASRDAVLEHLRERQIFAAVHYPLPVHLQEAAADWGYAEGSLPHAEALAREVLSLPIHPFLSESDQARVIDEVRAAVGA